MKSFALVATLIACAIAFKVWQCGELFPDANLLACMVFI